MQDNICVLKFWEWNLCTTWCYWHPAHSSYFLLTIPQCIASDFIHAKTKPIVELYTCKVIITLVGFVLFCHKTTNRYHTSTFILQQRKRKKELNQNKRCKFNPGTSYRSSKLLSVYHLNIHVGLFIHFHNCLSFCKVAVGLELIPANTGRGRGSPWTTRQFITGPRDKQPFTFTPTGNLKVIN